jgi:hypothetical protein
LVPPHPLFSFTRSGSHPVQPSPCSTTQPFKNNCKNGDCLQKTALFWPLFYKNNS